MGTPVLLLWLFWCSVSSLNSKESFHTSFGYLYVLILLIQVLCSSVGMSIFFLCYFKALFLQEESLNLTRQRQEQGCLCSFSRALGAISIHQAHPHPFLGPGPQSLVEDRWKITDMWTKDRNGPDLEPRGEVPSCPPAGPAYPHPLPTLLPPPQPAPGCHLQPLIHQSFRKWLLPSCLPQGYPTPPRPKAHLETRTQR